MNFFIGPMTKNVVDAIVDYVKINNKNITLIPSRRQIDYDSGYVNNWTTETFSKYIRSKTLSIRIERDHGGPGQGQDMDDGIESFTSDAKNFDIIHIDPWKSFQTYKDGLQKTIDLINYCYSINNNLFFEVGTEEAIRPFEVSEIESLILDLKKNLNADVYSRIKYVVIQCGTRLQNSENIGDFSCDKLRDMISIVKNYGLIPKEHNGDWVSQATLLSKKECGLECINIAPEFGEIETKVIYKYCSENEEWSEKLFNICLNSGKWKKWVDGNFDPFANKKKLIYICGHYVLSYPEFLELKDKILEKYPLLDNEIKDSVMQRLNELYEV